MATSGRDEILYVAIIISIVSCSATEVYTVRACRGEEANLTCSSGLYVDVIYGKAGFAPSGTSCTSRANCTRYYLMDATEGWKSDLDAYANNICINKETCSIMVKGSWEAGDDCGNELYDIIYAELDYKCSSRKYTARSCAGEEALLSCSSGHSVDVVYAVAGFGPSGTPCTNTATCTSTYIAGAREGVTVSFTTFANDMCKNKQSCSIMIKRSWRGGTSVCYSQEYDAMYAELVYKCSSIPPMTTTETTSPEISVPADNNTNKSKADAMEPTSTGSQSHHPKSAFLVTHWLYYVIGVMILKTMMR